MTDGPRGRRTDTTNGGLAGLPRTMRIVVIALCVLVVLALILYASRGLSLIWDLVQFLVTGKKQT